MHENVLQTPKFPVFKPKQNISARRINVSYGTKVGRSAAEVISVTLALSTEWTLPSNLLDARGSIFSLFIQFVEM